MYDAVLATRVATLSSLGAGTCSAPSGPWVMSAASLERGHQRHPKDRGTLRFHGLWRASNSRENLFRGLLDVPHLPSGDANDLHLEGIRKPGARADAHQTFGSPYHEGHGTVALRGRPFLLSHPPSGSFLARTT